jgi:TonB family protein
MRTRMLLFMVVFLSADVLAQEDSTFFEKCLVDGKAEVKRQLSLPDSSGDISKAIALLTLAAKSGPHRQEAYYFMGIAYDREQAGLSPGGKPPSSPIDILLAKRASACFKRCIEISPSYSGETIIQDPYGKLTSLWGDIALRYAFRGDLDSARWAWRYCQSEGGMSPVLVEYNRNVLSTCEQNAILFVNGDLDTYPLAYLQFVEGVRRDVTFINLSLINVSWYIKHTKSSRPFKESLPVLMSFSDEEVDKLQNVEWDTQQLQLPVPREVIAMYTPTDTAVARTGEISFAMPPTVEVKEVKYIRTQDRVVRDIIFTNNWKRPVYFALTCSPECKIGLDEYLWFRGLACHLQPHRMNDNVGIDRLVLEANLFDEPNLLKKTPQYGYTFGALKKATAIHDEGSIQLMVNSRNAFFRLAIYYAVVEPDPKKGLAILDRMEQLMPRKKIRMNWELMDAVANLYNRFGRTDKYSELADELEVIARNMIAEGKGDVRSYYNPYRVLLDIYEVRGQYDRSLELLVGLQKQFPSDSGLAQRIQYLKEATGDGNQDTLVVQQIDTTEALPDSILRIMADPDAAPADFMPVEKEPTVIKKVEPVYPASAMSENIQGQVWVKIWVDHTGQPREVKIKSTDHEWLNAAALEAARQWRFTPAMYDGKPVSIWVTIPFRFRLEVRKTEKTELKRDGLDRLPLERLR